MSTRAMILKDTDKGLYGIYLHNDGYPYDMKDYLLNTYDTPEIIDKLFSGGNMSVIGNKINPDPSRLHSFNKPQPDVCVYYVRDRGEEWEDNKPEYYLLDELREHSGIAYYYIYGKDNVWYYMSSAELDFVDGNYFLRKLSDLEDLPF